MSRIFYVDSRVGSDTNDGSAAAPWASLAQVSNAGLEAGDTVLFARDATFHGNLALTMSGAAGAPITFGAYGTGADPVISSDGTAVDASGRHDLTFQNLQFRNVDGSGIYADGADNIVIDHVTFDGVGGSGDESAIKLFNSTDVVVSNSTATHVNGDVFAFFHVDGLKVQNNDVHVPQGASSDNIHMQYIDNYEITGNTLSMQGPTDSGKGNMLVGQSDHGLIADNTLIAGNYGIGFDSANTVVEGNHFVNHDAASWSAALNMGAGQAENITIRNNEIDGARVGISLFELDNEWADTPVIRDNMTVENNVFNVHEKAVAFDGPVQSNGTFANNIISGADANSTADSMPEGWSEHGNGATATGPVGHSPVVSANEVFASAPAVSAPASMPEPALAPALAPELAPAAPAPAAPAQAEAYVPAPQLVPLSPEWSLWAASQTV